MKNHKRDLLISHEPSMFSSATYFTFPALTYLCKMGTTWLKNNIKPLQESSRFTYSLTPYPDKGSPIRITTEHQRPLCKSPGTCPQLCEAHCTLATCALFLPSLGKPPGKMLSTHWGQRDEARITD